MEWALLISDIESYHSLMSKYGGNLINNFDFTRIYYGNEFCQNHIPTPGELSNVMKSISLNKSFTLVTPYITQSYLNKLTEALEGLCSINPQNEVVVNDWGVLYLVRKNFPSLNPVLGRLLNKSLRDPRAAKNQINNISGGENSYRSSILAGPYIRKLLLNYGVKRVELDYLLQGLDPGLGRLGCQLSLYLPYGCITTGRICFFGSWGLKAGDKFKTSNPYCSRACKNFYLQMIDPSNPAYNNVPILQMGNAVFYEITGDLFKKSLHQAKLLGISRIVYQPAIIS